MHPVGRGLWISRHTSKIPSVNKWLLWWFALFTVAVSMYVCAIFQHHIEAYGVKQCRDLVAMETSKTSVKSVSGVVWGPEGGC